MSDSEEETSNVNNGFTILKFVIIGLLIALVFYFLFIKSRDAVAYSPDNSSLLQPMGQSNFDSGSVFTALS